MGGNELASTGNEFERRLFWRHVLSRRPQGSEIQRQGCPLIVAQVKDRHTVIGIEIRRVFQPRREIAARPLGSDFGKISAAKQTAFAQVIYLMASQAAKREKEALAGGSAGWVFGFSTSFGR